LIQVPALVENTAINIFAGALFCVLVILTWWVAITRPG